MRRGAEGPGRKFRRASICVPKLEKAQPLIAAHVAGRVTGSDVAPNIVTGTGSNLKRRRHNALCSIVVDGVVVEGVQPIRNAVFTHFGPCLCRKGWA